MASRAFWSDDELELLEQHVHDRSWFQKVRSAIRDRSEAALRKKMAIIRADRGMTDRRLSSWERDAAHASSALLRAIESAGVWP